MIPRNCMPVVKILRRDVKRPLLKDVKMVGCTPRISAYRFCPLGLHPNATDRTPWMEAHFKDKIFKEKEIRDFVNWWDKLSLAEAKQAVRLIWSKDKCKQ